MYSLVIAKALYLQPKAGITGLQRRDFNVFSGISLIL